MRGYAIGIPGSAVSTIQLSYSSILTQLHDHMLRRRWDILQPFKHLRVLCLAAHPILLSLRSATRIRPAVISIEFRVHLPAIQHKDLDLRPEPAKEAMRGVRDVGPLLAKDDRAGDVGAGSVIEAIDFG